MSEENTPPELIPENSPPPPPENPAVDPYAAAAVDPVKQQNDWAMITHLSGLCSAVGVPSFVGPLICWLIKKDEFPKVDFAGKEALNFQLTILIIELISVPLVFVFGLGAFTAIAAAIVGLIYTIIAAIAASKGEDYIYPYSFRMIK